MKTYVDGNGFFDGIGEMFKIIKKIEITLLDLKNIKNPVVDYIRCEGTGVVTCEEWKKNKNKKKKQIDVHLEEETRNT